MGRGISGKTGAYLLIGGTLLGAGLALLYAPQSGRRTRRDLSHYMGRMSHKAQNVAEDFGDSISDIIETLGDTAMAVLERGKDMALDARKELLQAVEEGQERLGKQRARLEKLVGRG